MIAISTYDLNMYPLVDNALMENKAILTCRKGWRGATKS